MNCGARVNKLFIQIKSLGFNRRLYHCKIRPYVVLSSSRVPCAVTSLSRYALGTLRASCACTPRHVHADAGTHCACVYHQVCVRRSIHRNHAAVRRPDRPSAHLLPCWGSRGARQLSRTRHRSRAPPGTAASHHRHLEEQT